MDANSQILTLCNKIMVYSFILYSDEVAYLNKKAETYR